LPLGHELEAEWLRTVSLSNGLSNGAIGIISRYWKSGYLLRS